MELLESLLLCPPGDKHYISWLCSVFSSLYFKSSYTKIVTKGMAKAELILKVCFGGLFSAHL